MHTENSRREILAEQSNEDVCPCRRLRRPRQRLHRLAQYDTAQPLEIAPYHAGGKGMAAKVITLTLSRMNLPTQSGTVDWSNAECGQHRAPRRHAGNKTLELGL